MHDLKERRHARLEALVESARDTTVVVEGPGRDPRSAASELNILLVEPRTLLRETVARSLSGISNCRVAPYASVEEWAEDPVRTTPMVVLLCVAGYSKNTACQKSISVLAQSMPDVPVVVLSDLEEPDEVVKILDSGVRGYIPTTVSLQVAVEAMRLVKAGGVFVPASSLIAAQRTPAAEPAETKIANEVFTARQAAVVEALRRGKANKIIAYELNMRESTVKVHVRNIMRKLKARNRTEVAFLLQEQAARRAGRLEH
jgi:DNA-binding NarL/FixJ family response regulator